MSRTDRLLYISLAALVATIPFEFRSIPLLSSLQWVFVLIGCLAMPVLVRERKRLLREPLVLAAVAFVATQWIAAMHAPEFTSNALKGGIRATAGLVLLCTSMCVEEPNELMTVWSISAVLAAAYGILDYAGWGIPRIFHDGQFYAGTAVRLTGSFEYPNTAAAFFAMSLPIVWTATRPAKLRWFRFTGGLLVWIALLLTYSRGAAISVLAMLFLWAVVRREKAVGLVFAACTGVFLLVLIASPLLLARFGTNPSQTAFAVQYEPEFNLLVRHPNETGTLSVRVRNAGTENWSAAGQPLMVASRWYDTEKVRYIGENKDYIPIANSLRPAESVVVSGSFVTPSTPGTYLMTWDILYPGRGWFSGNGVYPGLVEVHVQPGGEESSQRTDLSHWLRHDTARLFVSNISFSRSELWSAALGIVKKHALLGAGPDSFRLLYGRELRVNRWDTKIRSNNMYLELLSGSGLAGLLAFGAMMIATRWSTSPLCAALGIFLIHGLVDVFLMTTPIYFAFWILLGQIQCASSASITHTRSS